ncbi:MAG: hypothetical protein K2V71_08680 [Methylotenera sp.]|nr:hypothetical protein [Methylotenera sp.]OQW69155.1 MAG: hypothetical protein BVN34_06555 [Proteobacteria bacterium ST_bin12]
MKILNREKTHFMQKNVSGTGNVKFGSMSEVSALIDNILDGEKEKNPSQILILVDTDKSEKSNN